MENIQVSIIIATYNSASTLQIALESVISQTFQNWECIIVDGASKDNTIDIVKKYVAEDYRIRYVSERDNGIYDAFNKGWKMAKGEWIHYLGSDDRLTKDSFIELLKADDGKVAVISGAAYIEKIDGSVFVQSSVGWNGCHQSKLTRRTFLEKMNGFDETYRIKADKELYLRMEDAGYTVKNINTIVSYFGMDGMSQSLGSSVNRLKEDIRMYKKHPLENSPYTLAYRIFAKSVLSTIYRKTLSFIYRIEFKAR